MNPNSTTWICSAREFVVALAALVVVATVANAGPSLNLYDVNFDGPPHVIGATPAFGFGPYPRNTPTSGGGSVLFPTGSAIVISGAGQLVNRPVRLTAIDGTP